MKNEKNKNFELKRQEMFDTCSNLDELNNFIKLNSDFFISNPNNRDMSKKKNKEIKIELFFNFFDFIISNTHSAPIGMKENWTQSKDLPIGYPGWKGKIKINTNYEPTSFLTDLFKKTGINTGTGGGGEYELRIYAHDFKKMFLNEYDININNFNIKSALEKAYNLIEFNKCFKKYPELVIDKEIIIKSKEKIVDILINICNEINVENEFNNFENIFIMLNDMNEEFKINSEKKQLMKEIFIQKFFNYLKSDTYKLEIQDPRNLIKIYDFFKKLEMNLDKKLELSDCFYNTLKINKKEYIENNKPHHLIIQKIISIEKELLENKIQKEIGDVIIGKINKI